MASLPTLLSLRRAYQRDALSGALLFALGCCAALYAQAQYEFGSLFRIGPGFFPTVLGVLLAGCGAAMVFKAWWTKDPERGPSFAWRPFLLVVVSIALFALLIERLGLIITTFILVWVTAAADTGMQRFHRIALGVGLSLLCWLIFILVLGLPIHAFP